MTFEYFTVVDIFDSFDIPAVVVVPSVVVDEDVSIVIAIVIFFFFFLVSGRVRDMKLTMRKKEKRNLNLYLSKSPHHILDSCILDHPPLWTIIFLKLYPMG